MGNERDRQLVSIATEEFNKCKACEFCSCVKCDKSSKDYSVFFPNFYERLNFSDRDKFLKEFDKDIENVSFDIKNDLKGFIIKISNPEVPCE